MHTTSLETIGGCAVSQKVRAFNPSKFSGMRFTDQNSGLHYADHAPGPGLV